MGVSKYNTDVVKYGGTFTSIGIDDNATSEKLQVGDTRLDVSTPIFIAEQAAAATNVAGYGQIWVKNDTPSSFHFMDDAGNYSVNVVMDIIAKRYANVGLDSTADGYVVVKGTGYPGVQVQQFGNDADYPFLELKKNRGTDASPTGVSIGDLLGDIRFIGYNATPAEQIGAEIYVVTTATTGNLEPTMIFTTGSDGWMALSAGGSVEITTSGIDYSTLNVINYNDANAYGGGYIGVYRSGGTEGSESNLTAGRTIGEFGFNVYTGGTWNYSTAYIQAVTTVSTGNGEPTLNIGTGTSGLMKLYADGTLRQNGPVFIKETSAAATDVAAYGQFWAKNDTPNQPYFTNDAGTDYHLAKSTGSTGGTGSGGAGNQYIAISIGGTTYKVLHDGTV